MDVSTIGKSLTRTTLDMLVTALTLIQPPTTSYPHGYNDNQHGSSTSVKSYFLLPIPEWAVKTCHCTRACRALFRH
jgi:hypothetical protein